ncbi:MAG: integrase, partial [Zymomonas sp.]
MNMMHKIGRDGLTSAERAEVFRRQMLRERDWLETAPVQLQLADLRGELPEDLLSLRLDAEEAISRDRSVNGGVSPALALIIPDDDAPADVPIQIVAWDEIENSLGAEDAMEAAQMHLANLGIASTPLRLQMAHKIVHDARITAIRDYRKRLDNPSTAYPSVPVHFQEMAPVPDAVASARSVTHDHAVEAPPASTPGAGADSIWRQMGAFEAAAQFIEANPKTGGAEGDVRKHGKIWTKKTRDQFELPALLLEQVMEGRPLADVTDADLGRLNVCFNRLHGPSFRKSPRQCKMTIQEIVAETQERIKNGEIHRRDVGLGVSTTNRHWGYLRQLTKWFSRHQPIANLDYSAFIYQDMRDPRELSETYSIEEGEMVFSLPPWNGCEPIKRLKPGPFIIH